MKVAVAIAAGAAMLGSLYAEPVRLAENGRATGDITAKDRWVQRFAFPLDRMLDQPLAAGDSFHLNCMAVLGKDHVPERRGHVFVYGITPVTAAHDVDRMGTVRLAK